MFERFTDQSRRAVVLAQEEARRLDHGYIGTEHLLLGLRREDQGAAATALGSAGITLEAVRGAVETLVGRGQAEPSGHIPFTPRAKKCLELSLREALKLSHRYIGTGHLLLALISSDDCTAVRVLGELGADLEQLRAQVVTDIEDHQETPFGSPPPPSAVSWLRRGPMAEPVLGLLNMIEDRLSAIERHLGITPPASPEGLAAGSQAEGEAGQGSTRPDELARLQAEVARLRALLREHEIDPGDCGGAGAAAG